MYAAFLIAGNALTANNLYQYANGNPVANIDPTGEFAVLRNAARRLAAPVVNAAARIVQPVVRAATAVVNTVTTAIVAVAEVVARQRVLALFGKDGHDDGGLLVGGCVGVAVGEAAGEAVDWLFDGVDGHVHLFALDSVGDDDLHTDDSVGAHELNVSASGDAALGGEFG